MSAVLHPAYLAGIIDGEGSIFSRNRNPYISVGNTSRELIDALARLGGYVHERKPGRSIGTKVGWDWVITGEKAAILLRSCLSHLIIKRDKADAALAEWDTVTGSNHAHFVAAARREMAELGWVA